MKSWTLFLLGNGLVLGVLVIEIMTLSVCFEDFDGFENYNDDDRIQNRANMDSEDAYDLDEAEGIVYNMVMVALVAGLSLEVVSAIILSCTYKTPLDAKSAYKIPANDRRSCLAGFVARFLAPITWGLICVCMGAASYMYNSYSPCDGEHISERTRYAFLIAFGLLMAISGGMLVVISMLLACFACGIEPTCMGCCCSFGRRFMHKRVLATAFFFDLWWQLSGVMWVYRTGQFGLNATIGLLVVNVLGEVLSECGSSGPIDT